MSVVSYRLSVVRAITVLESGLPDDLGSLIQPEFPIRSDDRNVLAKRLGDELAIEWIAVVHGKLEHFESMLGTERQDAKIHIVDCLMHGCSGKPEFAERRLDCDLGERNAAQFADVVRFFENVAGALA